MSREKQELPKGLGSFAVLITGVSVAAILSLGAASAQEIHGAPGAPNATTTIDGHCLPPPPQPFGGEIELNAAQSKPYWPARVVPPKGAPNILLIMTDDVGFAAPSTFGGVIPTPALDRIAADGLRYTNFHTTSLCSPTRAALITGRNHHSVGFGVVSEQSTRLPRLQQHHPQGRGDHRPHPAGERLPHRPGSARTTTRRPIRRARPGRSTNGRPAWALNISTASSAATRASGSRTSSATRRRSIPMSGMPGWNLTTAMADDAIHWLNQLNDIDPSMPFFLYYVPGGTHAPHQPTPEWIKKISDMHLFDKGWNACATRSSPTRRSSA